MTQHPNDSVKLVPPIGDAELFEKRDQEKWLIYCPAIASDTLLLYITAGESYSLRSYGGRLGVNATGMHAEDAHTASAFRNMYEPEPVMPAEHFELAVHKVTQWEKRIAERWSDYRKKHPEVAEPGPVAE